MWHSISKLQTTVCGSSEEGENTMKDVKKKSVGGFKLIFFILIIGLVLAWLANSNFGFNFDSASAIEVADFLNGVYEGIVDAASFIWEVAENIDNPFE